MRWIPLQLLGTWHHHQAPLVCLPPHWGHMFGYYITHLPFETGYSVRWNAWDHGECCLKLECKFIHFGRGFYTPCKPHLLLWFSFPLLLLRTIRSIVSKPLTLETLDVSQVLFSLVQGTLILFLSILTLPKSFFHIALLHSSVEIFRTFCFIQIQKYHFKLEVFFISIPCELSTLGLVTHQKWVTL